MFVGISLSLGKNIYDINVNLNILNISDLTSQLIFKHIEIFSDNAWKELIIMAIVFERLFLSEIFAEWINYWHNFSQMCSKIILYNEK